MKTYFLNRTPGSAPLYGQIIEILKEEIEKGVYQRGEKIPTENGLMDMFRVSRSTIRQAIDALVAEGLLVRERPKGTRVADWSPEDIIPAASLPNPSDELDLDEVHHRSPAVVLPERMSREAQASFSVPGIHEELSSLPYEITTPSIQVTTCQASPELLEKLKLPENSELTKVTRILAMDGVPSIYIETYLPPWLYASTDPKDYEVSLYSYLKQENGIQIQDTMEEIGVDYADPELAGILNLPRACPVLRVERVAKDQQGRIVEYSVARSHPEKYTVKIHRS